MTMQKNDVVQGYYRRFPILSWLGIILCFVLFPAGLINLALEQLFAARSANSREEIAVRMEKALKTVELFSDNEYFAHFLLLNLNEKVLAAKNPEQKLAQLKARLQKRYPGAFTFICWDGKGELLKEVSDEKSFGYIIKKTWQFLKKASELLGRWDETHEKVNLATLADVEKESKMLRNFLGKLLVSYQLRFPWLSGQLGRPVQAARPGPRSRIWYRINDRFGFLCFISDSFIKSTAGTEFAVRQTRGEMPEFSVHVTDYPASENFFPPADPAKAPRMVQALSRFEEMSPESFEVFDDLLVGCRLVSQNSRAVCHCPAELLFSPELARFAYLGKAARLVLPLLFVFMVWYKTRSSGFISIRLKLVVIFFYAGGIPLLIMGSIGIEYLEQKRQQLVYEGQTRGINVLYTIDRHFQNYLEDQARYLSELILGYNHQHQLKALEPTSLINLRARLLEETRPESIQIYNEKGQGLVEDSVRTIFSDYTIPSQIAIEVLNSTRKIPGTGKPQMLSGRFGIDAMARKREISTLGLGAHELYFFFDFFGQPWKYENLAMLQLFWRREKLQRTFFEKFHAESMAGKFSDGTEVIAYYPVEDLIFSTHPESLSLKDFCQNAYANQISRKNLLELKAGKYSAVAMRGMILDRICLLFLLPLDGIERAMGVLQLQMAGMGAVFLLMTFLMFRFLADRFLLPVGALNNAIRAINERDFSFRLSIASSREFRELASTFNVTLETLRDLETARIVQENLLPEREYAIGSLRLVAFSQAFARIGGDYYDFFAVDQNTLGVFIGDVSGHGIPAALIMAMAKATMISVRNEFVAGEQLMDALDQMLFLNRKSGSREYMTGLFLTVNSETGQCLLINRGHCMPILVSSDGTHVKHIKSGGLPLGYNRPGSNQKVEFSIEPGETICLYTDGISEACDRAGAVLGYDGFMQMLKKCWNVQADSFLISLRELHQKSFDKPEDDQTVVMIRRNG